MDFCTCVKVIERLTERELEVLYLVTELGYLYLRQLSKKGGSRGWPEKARSKAKTLAFVLPLLRLFMLFALLAGSLPRTRTWLHFLARRVDQGGMVPTNQSVNQPLRAQKHRLRWKLLTTLCPMLLRSHKSFVPMEQQQHDFAFPASERHVCDAPACRKAAVQFAWTARVRALLTRGRHQTK